MAKHEVNDTLRDAISAACSSLEELGSEMQEWADNIEEKFSATEKFSTISDTASNLTNLSEPDVPEWMNEKTVTYTLTTQKRMSRAARRDEATYILSRVVDFLDEVQEQEDLEEGKKTDAENLRDEVQNIIDEAEACEFPGMFG